MSDMNYVKVYDNRRLDELKQTLTDYLFDKGHQITKPMIDDLAIIVYDLQDKITFDNVMATHAQASPKDINR